jgi:hypothetical protein
MFPGKLSLSSMARQEYAISYQPYPEIAPIKLTEVQSKLSLFIDGANSVTDCAHLAGLRNNQRHIATTYFRSIWRLGLITFRTIPNQ